MKVYIYIDYVNDEAKQSLNPPTDEDREMSEDGALQILVVDPVANPLSIKDVVADLMLEEYVSPGEDEGPIPGEDDGP